MEDSRAPKRPRLGDGVPAPRSALETIMYGQSGPLPHARSDCPHWVFRPSVDDDSHWINKNVCELCFCLVCDRKVSECPAWPVHCMAYFESPMWGKLRTVTRDGVRVVLVPVSLVPPRVRSNKSMRRFLLDDADEAPQATLGVGNVSARRVALPNAAAASPDEVIDLDQEEDFAKNGSCMHSVSVRTAPVSVDKTPSEIGVNLANQNTPKEADSEHAASNKTSAEIAGSNRSTANLDDSGASVAAPGPFVHRNRSLDNQELDPQPLQRSPVGDLAQPSKGLDDGPVLACFNDDPSGPSHRVVASKSEPIVASSVVLSRDIGNGAKERLNISSAPREEQHLHRSRMPRYYPRNIAIRDRYWQEVSRKSTSSGTERNDGLESGTGISIQRRSNDLDTLKDKWVVDRLLPSPSLKAKLSRLQNTPPRANLLPTRILVGTIDLWRPYCSHMSARSMDLSLGCGHKDVVSFISPADVAVDGMKDSHVKVLAREMGLCLSDPELIPGHWVAYLKGENILAPGWMMSKSSFAWEDKSDMSEGVLDGLISCVYRKDLEVRWELLHHSTSDNEHKAFAHCHDIWLRWDSKTLRELFKDQLGWLNKRNETIKRLSKYDISNCCVLRASIYVTPNALGSNMVTAAKACVEGSAYAYMKPLDGGSCLAERNGMPKKAGLPWSETEMRIKTDNADMAAIFAALKPIRSCGLQDQSKLSRVDGPTSPPNSSIAASPFQSLCRTYRQSLDQSTRDDAKDLVSHLQELTVARGMDSENKTSVDAILSSKRFVVSDGYSRAAEQPSGIKLPLRLYQKESLAWMIDKERMKSISEPFWTKISGKTVTGDKTDLYYSPLTGALTRYPPPPVVGGVLAEEMGLGKTLIMTSLIVSTLDQARRSLLLGSRSVAAPVQSHGTLIVCPVSLLKQWEQELQTKVSAPLKILLWYGQNRPRSEVTIGSFDVVLTTYGILSRQESYRPLTKINWYRLVIDESTYLRGGANFCSSVLSEELISSRRWAVSGTPFGNNFKNFLGTMRFLGVVPFSHSRSFEGLSRVATSSTGSLTKMENFHMVPQLAYVLKHLMMRHLKDQDFRGQTLVELPPATGRRVRVVLSAEERALYQGMESEAKTRAARYLRSQRSAGSNYITLRSIMIPLRIMADGVPPEKAPAASPGSAKKEDSIVHSALAKAKVEPQSVDSLSSSKVRQLLNDVRTYRAADPSAKFVVFTEFRSVKNKIQTTLKSHGVDVLTLDGTMTAGRRGKMIKMFAEDADIAVLVLSMRLGACGLTLTMANVVVLFEVGLDIALELQAVNRIHRIGQTRQVETLTYAAEGTIDERITEVRTRRGQPGVVGESVEAGQKKDMSTVEVYRGIFDYSPS